MSDVFNAASSAVMKYIRPISMIVMIYSVVVSVLTVVAWRIDHCYWNAHVRTQSDKSEGADGVWVPDPVVDDGNADEVTLDKYSKDVGYFYKSIRMNNHVSLLTLLSMFLFSIIIAMVVTVHGPVNAARVRSLHILAESEGGQERGENKESVDEHKSPKGC